MKAKDLAMLPILVILVFLVSCSTRSSLSSPAAVESASKSVAGSVSKDAPQTEWERTVLAAKREGRIVVYAAFGMAAARDTLIQAVNEKFGITLEMTIAQGPLLTSKLVSERRAGLYMADVYTGGAESMLNDLIPRNIFQPIEPYLMLPEVKSPSSWLGASLPFWEKQRVSLATLALIPAGPTAYNTSLLKPEELTSYKDLLKPQLKGVIVMFDPTIAGQSWVPLANKLMGEDYLRELVKQDVVVTRDIRLMDEWIARGKYPLGLGVDPGGIRTMIKDGATVAILSPFKEGVDLGPAGGNMAVIDQNPHPNATRVFVNWLLTKEGQTIVSKALGIASRRLDVPTGHLASPWMVPDPKIKYIIHDEDYSKYKLQMQSVSRTIFAPVLR